MPVLSKDVELGMWAASEAEGTDRDYSVQITPWDREYPEEEERNTEKSLNARWRKSATIGSKLNVTKHILAVCVTRLKKVLSTPNYR